MFPVFKMNRRYHGLRVGKCFLSLCLVLILLLSLLSAVIVSAEDSGESEIGNGSDYIKVTFDTDGGIDVEPAFKIVEKAGIFGALPETSKDGFVFMGWTRVKPIEENDSEPYPARPLVKSHTLVNSVGDFVLYAKWESRITLSVDITFAKMVGSTLSFDKKTVQFGDEYGALAVSTCKGLKFVGWYTEPDGKGDLILNHTIVTAMTVHTLYAKWDSLPRIGV